MFLYIISARSEVIYMFNKNDVIRFSCTECGKCCSTPPRSNFYDAIMLSDEFIFQTAHHAILSYTKKPLDKELADHYKIIAHSIVMPELDAMLYYYLDFTPIANPTYKSCPKLVDNKCSIYGKRPTSCKSYPLSATVAEEEQWRTLNFFKKNVDEKDWKCDFSEKSPILFADESIYNPGQNALYYQSVESLRDFTDRYIEFIGNDKKYQDNHFRAVFQSVSRNQLMISDMIVSLQVARYFNILTEEEVVSFIENQIRLIEKESTFSISLKMKDNLQVSRLYKKQKEEYLKALDKQIFKEHDVEE